MFYLRTDPPIYRVIRPKGALHTCGSLSTQVATLVSDWKYSEDDCFIHCLPLHHVHGLGAE